MRSMLNLDTFSWQESPCKLYIYIYTYITSRHARPPRNRKWNITWFNPPYSKNVETNVGKCFLLLIDQYFPKSNPLHKIFNRDTLKLSYSCMGNFKTIISNHNKAVISKSTRTNNQTKKSCNCRKPNVSHGRKL